MSSGITMTGLRSIKRFTALLLALFFCFSLASCNRQSSPTATPIPETNIDGQDASSAAAESDADVAEMPATSGTPGIGSSTAPESASQDTETSPASGTSSQDALAGTLMLWHSWAGAEGDALAEMLSTVQAQYPGVQIETLFVASHELLPSFVEAVAAGGGPDLVLAPNWELYKLAATGTIQPLDALLEQHNPNLQSQYWPGATASLRVDGQLYALPVSYQTVALLVNTNLVALDEIPSTTDTLLTAVRDVEGRGIGIYASLLHTAWGFPAYGAQWFDDSGTVILDQTGDAAAYLTWLANINQAEGSFVSADYSMLLERFRQNELAYFVDGPWALPDLSAALGDALHITSLPSGPVGPSQPWLYSDGLFINASRDELQQRLALTIAEALTTGSGAQALTTSGTLLPAVQSVDLNLYPHLAGFAVQAATATAMPTRPEMDNAWGYGGDMIIKAITGVTPPPAIVAETTALINEANGRLLE